MPHSHSAAAHHRDRLVAVLGITLLVFAVELVGGLASNSLALIADAGHVFTDVVGVGLALGAIWIAARPPSGGRTFGFYRAEILGAVLNAALLFGVAAFVLYEAWQRLLAPPAVTSGLMLVVAIGGGAANLVSLRLLRHARHESLNLRGAYLEVLGDLLGSVAVVVAAIVIALTGNTVADPIASVVIGALIIPRTWGLLREALDILLEATPKGIDLDVVRSHILEAEGVADVHDLHAWTITSGMNVVSAHVVVRDDAKPGAILDHLGLCLSEDFDIKHSTFQLETKEHVAWEARGEQASL
jgi:cobalt-zinc-cadmium efflux system protein